MERPCIESQPQNKTERSDTATALPAEHEPVEDPRTNEQVYFDEIVPNTLTERLYAASTREVVEHGLEHPADYETFTIQEVRYTEEKQLWISFPGLGDGREARELGSVEAHSITPKQGVAVIFSGPAGIAGASPQQCIECTDRVYAEVQNVVERYPDHVVNIVGFSAGTHLAHYIANQLGEKYQEQKVQKLISIASGTSIGMGIFSTDVVKPLAEHLYKNGWDKYKYTEAIEGYSQKDNTKWLPSGEDLQMWYGGWDRFIPPDKEGGTKDLIELLRESGKNPKAIETHLDHVLLPGYLAIVQHLGYNPYGLDTQGKIKWSESDEFRAEYEAEVERRFDALDQRSKDILAGYLSQRSPNLYSGTKGQQLLKQMLKRKGFLSDGSLYYYVVSKDVAARLSTYSRFSHQLRTFLTDTSTHEDSNTYEQLIEQLTDVDYLTLREETFRPPEEQQEVA